MLSDNPEFRKAMAALMRCKEEALADFRQHFYMLLPEEQTVLKRNLQRLIAASRPFGCSHLSVQLRLAISAYCPQTQESLYVSAVAEPDEVLGAIEDWEKADEKTVGLQ